MSECEAWVGTTQVLHQCMSNEKMVDFFSGPLSTDLELEGREVNPWELSGGRESAAQRLHDDWCQGHGSVINEWVLS